jgi:ABC-2 type transport system ATP-binding protein
MSRRAKRTDGGSGRLHGSGGVRSDAGEGEGGLAEAPPAIELRNLTKRYGDGGVLAVDGLDLVVERGEVFGLLGPNGAGKSTTIDMVLDYVRPTAGAATVLGLDSHDDAAAIRERIGVLPEGFGLYDRLTGRRHLEFAIEWADADDEPATLLERVGLAPADAQRPVGDYSKGMQKRLATAMALVGDPDLLVLDEPSAGLDPHGISRLRSIVREEAARGTTVVFSSHLLDQVEAVCDRVGILADGELVAVDAVERLRETVGAGAELRLRIDGDVDERAVEGTVETVDGVGDATIEGSVVRAECVDPRAKGHVVAALVDSGVDVLDVDSETADLADVFAAYTDGAGEGDGDDSGAGDEDDREDCGPDDRDGRERPSEVIA